MLLDLCPPAGVPRGQSSLSGRLDARFKLLKRLVGLKRAGGGGGVLTFSVACDGGRGGKCAESKTWAGPTVDKVPTLSSECEPISAVMAWCVYPPRRPSVAREANPVIWNGGGSIVWYHHPSAAPPRSTRTHRARARVCVRACFDRQY